MSASYSVIVAQCLAGVTGRRLDERMIQRSKRALLAGSPIAANDRNGSD
jgi:hypothetical protein